MIGLSLSFCVRDILNGDMSIDNVSKIITGTRAERNSAAWFSLIGGYLETYWADFSKSDVYDVVNALTIEQPRLTDNNRYPVVYSGHWVNSENDIVWSTDI